MTDETQRPANDAAGDPQAAPSAAGPTTDGSVPAPELTQDSTAAPDDVPAPAESAPEPRAAQAEAPAAPDATAAVDAPADAADAPADAPSAETADPSARPARPPRSRGQGRGRREAAATAEAAAEAEWTLDENAVEDRSGKDRFQDFALPLPLLHAIADLGFSYCTPIQSASLPYALSDYDITGQAQTGTGKTAAFLITILTRLCEQPPRGPRRPGSPRALVLAPTRELAMQIEKDARGLAKHLPIGLLTVVGGMDFDRQKDALESTIVDVLVATPGRLIDFMNRNAVNLRQVEVLVIDEADRMLDMGFIPDVRRIVYRTPHKKDRQTLFFSATFSFDVLNLAKQWTQEPVHVAIEPEKIAVDTVDQHVYVTTAREKFTVLFNLIKRDELSRVLIFANRRDVTRDICERLQRLGVACEMLSGEVPQKKRLRALEQFREGVFPVLIATDVAGRGIHIEGVSHVINYNLPEDPEDYVHRIGRTGRAGALGMSIALVSEEDAFELPQIETLLGRPLPIEHPSPELLAPLPAGGGRAPRPPRDGAERSGDRAGDRGGDRGGRSGSRSGPPRPGTRNSSDGPRPPRRPRASPAAAPQGDLLDASGAPAAAPADASPAPAPAPTPAAPPADRDD